MSFFCENRVAWMHPGLGSLGFYIEYRGTAFFLSKGGGGALLPPFTFHPFIPFLEIWAAVCLDGKKRGVLVLVVVEWHNVQNLTYILLCVQTHSLSFFLFCSLWAKIVLQVFLMEQKHHTSTHTTNNSWEVGFRMTLRAALKIVAFVFRSFSGSDY